VRLAKRIPVGIHIDQVPPGVALVAFDPRERFVAATREVSSRATNGSAPA